MIRARRVATGLALGAVVIGFGAVDVLTDTRYATCALIVLLLVRALAEAYGLFKSGGIACHAGLGVVVLVAGLVIRALAPDLGLTADEGRAALTVLLGLGAVGPVALAIAGAQPPEGPQPRDLVRTAATALPLVWIGVLGAFLLELRLVTGTVPGAASEHGLDRGLALVLVSVAAVKLGDSAAYFVGRAIGRHPLSWVSPKKTWEGALASVIASVAVAVLLGTWFGWETRLMAGLGLVVNLAGQGGDLVESYFKRGVGAKDTASIFGEIGGVLDMLDALLLAAPFAYLYVQLLIVRGA